MTTETDFTGSVERAKYHITRARKFAGFARDARRRYTENFKAKVYEYTHAKHPTSLIDAQFKAAAFPDVRYAAGDDQMYSRWASLEAQLATMEMAAAERNIVP